MRTSSPAPPGRVPKAAVHEWRTGWVGISYAGTESHGFARAALTSAHVLQLSFRWLGGNGDVDLAFRIRYHRRTRKAVLLFSMSEFSYDATWE